MNKCYICNADLIKNDQEGVLIITSYHCSNKSCYIATHKIALNKESGFYDIPLIFNYRDKKITGYFSGYERLTKLYFKIGEHNDHRHIGSLVFYEINNEKDITEMVKLCCRVYKHQIKNIIVSQFK